MKGEGGGKNEQKKLKKVEHDFVLNVSLSFVSSCDVRNTCVCTSSFVFFLLMTVYLTFVAIFFYLGNSVFVYTRFCVSLTLRSRR